jgi:hypothetical protein
MLARWVWRSILFNDGRANGLVPPYQRYVSVPIAPTGLPPAAARSLLSRLVPFLFLSALLWLTWCDGRVPPYLSPTVGRTLYFKLPIDGTRFHWTFLDRRAFLSGELTLRIVNADRNRDQTLVIFRSGKITEGWEMIGDVPRDSSFYFGFSTGQRIATAVGDSVIVTLIAMEDLRGRGPYSQGTLAKGTWVATGTYTALYGGTLNPLRDLVRAGDPPIAFLTCWDTSWVLRDASEEGWMGSKPTDEDDVGFVTRLKPERGVDGRRCRSRL